MIGLLILLVLLFFLLEVGQRLIMSSQERRLDRHLLRKDILSISASIAKGNYA